jgi:Family of unknown function (DUF6221)
VSTLPDYLLARYDEDDERTVHDFDCDRFNVYNYGARQGTCDCTATALLRAQTNANRRIVTQHTIVDGRCHVCAAQAYGQWARFRAPCPTLLALAAVYVTRPDFDPAWTDWTEALPL